jgi:hypothetical protein
MKKFIAVMVVLMGLMTACDMEYGTAEEIEIGNVYDYDFENDIPEMKTVNEIALYVKNNTDYIHDIDAWGVNEYWQTPEETYYFKTGDCEDRILFFQYLLKKQLNIKVNFIVIKYSNGLYHVITKIENIYYDFPSSSDNNSIIMKYTELPKYAKFINSATYSEALWMTINYHEGIGKYK